MGNLHSNPNLFHTQQQNHHSNVHHTKCLHTFLSKAVNCFLRHDDEDGNHPLPTHNVPTPPRTINSSSSSSSSSSIITDSPNIQKISSASAIAGPKITNTWIKHYSSRHRMLLVGEGDFSFSYSLAVAFGDASNMIATSFDSKTFLKKHYSSAWSNVEELKRRGCHVMHWVDATDMTNDEFLGEFEFDRIVFNFPYAGFFKDKSRDSQLRLHRRLVRLFMKNAKKMLSENGEIHITHKTNGFNLEWNLGSLASSEGLKLIEAVDFKIYHYPGYNTKRGFGGDESFNWDPSKTYKFQR